MILRRRASRIGAALSSIGALVPSLAISSVWFARPTIGAFAQRPRRRVLDRLCASTSLTI